jgi:hypothetical protein
MWCVCVGGLTSLLPWGNTHAPPFLATNMKAARNPLSHRHAPAAPTSTLTSQSQPQKMKAGTSLNEQGTCTPANPSGGRVAIVPNKNSQRMTNETKHTNTQSPEKKRHETHCQHQAGRGEASKSASNRAHHELLFAKV